MNIQFLDIYYDWSTISLKNFLDEGNIPSGWLSFFTDTKTQFIVENISNYLDNEKETIYPPINQIFRSLYFVKPQNIKVVILGQDPYHNGSAVGLCFSVKKDNYINPSLKNIYKELKNEGFNPEENGDISHWAKQGVLMLNTSLTVRKGQPGSHTDVWYNFTIHLIKNIGQNKEIKWILLGRDAQSVIKYIKGQTLCASHPSPFSANKKCGNYPPFIGSGIFKEISEINW